MHESLSFNESLPGIRTENKVENKDVCLSESYWQLQHEEPHCKASASSRWAMLGFLLFIPREPTLVGGRRKLFFRKK